MKKYVFCLFSLMLMVATVGCGDGAAETDTTPAPAGDAAPADSPDDMGEEAEAPAE